MTTESPDQIRANYIAVMGPSLGAEFHELMQDAARLHLKWNEFKTLFSAGTEKIELLNKTAPGFFWLTQNAWWHDIVLHIFRMSDDDRKVLSILKLKVPSALVDEFKVKIHALKAATKFAHKLRNEYIAHRNREVALQVRPIPDSSLQQVQTAIAAIDDALHLVDQHFTKRLPTMYDRLDIRGGSKSLLWIVRRGLVARDDDISHHRPMMRFTE
jgi:hypothetical protein